MNTAEAVKCMVKVAIVDDEQYHRSYIKKYIQRMDNEISEKVELFEYSSGEALIEADEKDFHLVLLDQKMNGMSGTETAQRIRAHDKSVLIIFVTALEELWEDGYGVQAFYYLTKPIDESKFKSVFKRAMDKIREERQPITIQTVNGLVVFDIRNIIYLVNNDRHTDIHYYDRKKKTIVVEKIKKSIKETSEPFVQYDFVRPHVSYLVNPIHIRRVFDIERDKYLELVTGENILISRERLHSVYDIVMKSLNKRTFMMLPEYRHK